MHCATALCEPVNFSVRMGSVCWICPTLVHAASRATRTRIAVLPAVCFMVTSAAEYHWSLRHGQSPICAFTDRVPIFLHDRGGQRRRRYGGGPRTSLRAHDPQLCESPVGHDGGSADGDGPVRKTFGLSALDGVVDHVLFSKPFILHPAAEALPNTLSHVLVRARERHRSDGGSLLDLTDLHARSENEREDGNRKGSEAHKVWSGLAIGGIEIAVDHGRLLRG